MPTRDQNTSSLNEKEKRHNKRQLYILSLTQLVSCADVLGHDASEVHPEPGEEAVRVIKKVPSGSLQNKMEAKSFSRRLPYRTFQVDAE
ncbi:MAG: hypothetical protein JWQ40_4369 [Segetibacter sp.]|jgi:hypothetical protein|nr:hypothetical protein [Segetibacter sp.]